MQFDRRALREDTAVRLRVRAIDMCESSEDDLAPFIRMVRWLAERERAFQPSSPHQVEQVRVTSEQLSADLAAEGRHVDALALRKLWMLADVERISWGGSFDLDGDPVRWEMNLRRDIRPFRRVETLEDFVSVRDRLDEAAAEEARRAYGIPDLIAADQPRAPTIPQDDRLYVFIAMPFGEPWSDAVRALIEQACERAHDSGLRLRWERADEIDQPGRITEQIVDAVSTADVVIADITDANPNVIYEIAYAEANGIPVIALNQDPSKSPFDLRISAKSPTPSKRSTPHAGSSRASSSKHWAARPDTTRTPVTAVASRRERSSRLGRGCGGRSERPRDVERSTRRRR